MVVWESILYGTNEVFSLPKSHPLTLPQKTQGFLTVPLLCFLACCCIIAFHYIDLQHNKKPQPQLYISDSASDLTTLGKQTPLPLGLDPDRPLSLDAEDGQDNCTNQSVTTQSLGS